MDYYKKMAQPKMDFSVFKPKRSKRAEEQESSAENTAKSIPNPKAVKEQETPVQEPKAKQSQEDIPVSSETKKERKSELTALELQVDQSMSEQKESEESGKVIRFRVPENRNEEAALKLEAELETAKSNLLLVFPIVRYLKKKCLDDEAFAELVMDERKTLDKCFSYVTDEVKKALNSNTGWLDDNEVYAYAETYFLTDEAVFERIAAEKAAAEKKRQEDVAKRRKEQEEKRKNAVKERRKTTPKKPVSQEPKTENAEESKMQEQLCLNV